MPFSHSRPSNKQRHGSSTPHYQTFPTKPPKTSGRPLRDPDSNKSGDRSDSGNSAASEQHHHHASPLPMRQLLVLAIIALAEQTAFNSISPYLPDMTSKFPDIADPSEVGLYVGLIATSFALAQFTTNFFWGWLSDRIGRKPVILIGTLLTAACFVAFGFCKTLWQAIVVQICMGLVNGNQGVVSTCLGEITDRSNQSRAFTYLPVVYGIGAVTGPIVGGLLVHKAAPLGLLSEEDGEPKYPYLAPNLLSAAILMVDLFIAMIFMEESLEEAKSLPPLGKRVTNLFAWFWQFTAGSSRPSFARIPRHPSSFEAGAEADNEHDNDDNDEDDDASSSHSDAGFLPNTQDAHHLSARDVLNRDTFLILTTYFVFQLSNIAYNSLYPIFAQAAPPTGRELSPREIGISLAFAGVVTIVFQVGIFGKLKEKIGNKVTYRVGLGGFVIAFLLMPWVGYKNGNGEGPALGKGKGLLWTELGVVLVIKTVATVGGLTSALLLVCGSEPCR